jgi:hypothetical protein
LLFARWTHEGVSGCIGSKLTSSNSGIAIPRIGQLAPERSDRRR